MDKLYEQIAKIIDRPICDSENTCLKFLKRLEQGALTRDENPQAHFCVYFLPYNQKEGKVFIVHHKKSGFWLSPGGHIEKGEGLLEALNREIDEELGIENFFQEAQTPFLLTITPIENKARSCKFHYDIWYLVLTDGSNFRVDPEEFHQTRWLTIKEAKKIVADKPNRIALEVINKRYKQ